MNFPLFHNGLSEVYIEVKRDIWRLSQPPRMCFSNPQATKRARCVAQWCLMPCAALAGCLLAPCFVLRCCSNPLPKMVLHDDDRDAPWDDEPTRVCDTVGSAVVGIVGTVGCIGTCAGCFGKHSPRSLM